MSQTLKIGPYYICLWGESLQSIDLSYAIAIEDAISSHYFDSSIKILIHIWQYAFDLIFRGDGKYTVRFLEEFSALSS